MARRSLLLPVETLNREFDGKLLLALHAAARGWEPIIGKRSTLHDNLPRLPRSVYFSKGFRSGNRAMFRIILGLGHTIVGLDEEALANISDEMWLLKMDPEVLSALSIAFAWGQNDARLYGMAKGIGGTPIIETGNPRVDMLRPELDPFFAEEVSRLRDRFGRFALFNTNFSMVNNFVEGHTRFRVADWAPEGRASELKAGWLGHKARLLDAFIKMLPALGDALRPNVLVIRPHPSENPKIWQDATSGLDNVHVLHEGNVVPWLAAAQVLIHNGCTSAVEASILGTPALSYRPVKQPGFDVDLANGLSREFEDAEALCTRAAAIVHDRPTGRVRLDSDRQAILDRHIAALDGPLACSRLLDEIEQQLGDPARPYIYRYVAARTTNAIRRLSRNIRKRSKTAKGNPTYLSYKFPNIDVSFVNERINRLDAALDGFGHFGAEVICPNLFRIVQRTG